MFLLVWLFGFCYVCNIMWLEFVNFILLFSSLDSSCLIWLGLFSIIGDFLMELFGSFSMMLSFFIMLMIVNIFIVFLSIFKSLNFDFFNWSFFVLILFMFKIEFSMFVDMNYVLGMLKV